MKEQIKHGKDAPKVPRKGKYPFSSLKKESAFFAEKVSTQTLITSFKAWCSRKGKDWMAQCWSAEENGTPGAWIKRIK